jgi:hypothetical protein
LAWSASSCAPCARLPRLVLGLLGGPLSLLFPLSCAVGILLCDAGLVFHSLLVTPQLADRQVNKSALVPVALVLVSSFITFRSGLLSPS